MVTKCIVHIHITAEIKAYWIAYFSYTCNNVESIYRL